MFKEHSVKIASHGNSTKSESYTCTMPSVMSKLKSASSTSTTKSTLSLVTEDITIAFSTALCSQYNVVLCSLTYNVVLLFAIYKSTHDSRT